MMYRLDVDDALTQAPDAIGYQPKTVYLWQNDMVMTFGDDDEQIPGLQGPLTEHLLARLETAATAQASWLTGTWSTGQLTDHDERGWFTVARARLCGDRAE